MDPGSILWRALFFFFFFFFFSTSFFFSLSLSLSARWFNTYQIPILFLSSFSFFPSLALFFPLFCPPPTFSLPSFFFSFSYSFPIPFLLLVPFFLPLSVAFISLIPLFPSKSPGENTESPTHIAGVALNLRFQQLPTIKSTFFFSFSYSFPIPFLLLVPFFLPLSVAFISLIPLFPSKSPGENTESPTHIAGVALNLRFQQLPTIKSSWWN